MPPAAIVLLLEPRFNRTAFTVMRIFRTRLSLSRLRIHVETTELLATFPAPGFPAACANQKRSLRLETARKNIITRSIF